jgi:hypothetical protein
MDNLRSGVEGESKEVRALKRTIRILLVIILILIGLSLTLGYCSYNCINDTDCTMGTPTETSLPDFTLPPELTKMPTETMEATSTSTPTETKLPTPDFGATATQACSDFMDEFPGTPCP